MSSSQTLGPSEDAQPVPQSSAGTTKRFCFCFDPECAVQNSIFAQTCHRCEHSLRLQGRFRAIREIGQGKFAKTYEAIDEGAGGRSCVIKQFLLKPGGIDAYRLQSAKNLFQQEALILQRLGTHPQIPELIAFIEAHDSLFLVQEFVSGLSLYQGIKQTPESFAIDIEGILLDLLPVLSFIHSHGIIHRDIKLGNIIQPALGRLWLVDFGAAYHQNLGRFGIAGTLGYAAPEQLQGQALPSSDLYSLAVTCVSLLTGNILDTAESDFHTPDEFLRCLWNYSGQRIRPQLAQLLERMLQPEIGARYKSATEVLRELRPIESPASSVNYRRLQMFLADEAYQEADQETWQILLRLSGHLPHDMLTVDAIERISFTNLRILDQLWSTASGGRFGFGVQLRLFQRQGNIRDFDFDRWQRFAEQVGWCVQGKWLSYHDLGFCPESPPGHLPAIFTSLENRHGQFCGPLGWWRLGFMSLIERFSLSGGKGENDS